MIWIGGNDIQIEGDFIWGVLNIFFSYINWDSINLDNSYDLSKFIDCVDMFYDG